MIKLLESTVFGNTVGIISFIIGIISFIMTIKVNKSAKEIKRLVNKAQSKAVNGVNLRNSRQDFIERFSNLSQSIKNARYVSLHAASDINGLSLILSQYKDCIGENSLEIFQEANNYFANFPETDDEEKIRKLLAYIAVIIDILKKGDFIDGR
mgnify:CR=1 FL=1